VANTHARQWSSENHSLGDVMSSMWVTSMYNGGTPHTCVCGDNQLGKHSSRSKRIALPIRASAGTSGTSRGEQNLLTPCARNAHSITRVLCNAVYTVGIFSNLARYAGR